MALLSFFTSFGRCQLRNESNFLFFADVQGEDGPGVAEPGVGAVAVEMVGPRASPEPPGGGAFGAHYRGPEHHGAHASAS